MTIPHAPAWFNARLVSNEDALAQLVKSGQTIGSGFGPSEPHTFYSSLWDHILQADIHRLRIRSAFFMAPHRVALGDALQSKGLFANGVPAGLSFFGSLARKVNAVTKKLEGLSHLIDHYEELKRRDIVFVNAFLSPVLNAVIPDNQITRLRYPDYVNRNTTRTGVTDMQSIHFPDALEGMAYTPEGTPMIDTYVMVMTPPDEEGFMSHGIANGANGEVLARAAERCDLNILLYVNAKYPFTYGYGDAPNHIHIGLLEKLANAGRLFVVEDDGRLPSLPPNSFDNPLPQEIAIAEHVVNHMEVNRDLTYGRTMQVGFGGTGVLAIKALKQTQWTGRSYSEMLETFTLDLFEMGKIKGTHFITKSGAREPVEGKMTCTFTIADEASGFYPRIHRHPGVVIGPASRVVIPEGFYHGLGINNCLGIDFHGHVNSTGRYQNLYSGVGGLAQIMRGLSKGGIGYLCMKSTHSNNEGKLRSSVFPFLPSGTPVSLIGPDIMAGREGARFFLVTEHGVARLSGLSQSQLIRNLISVADPRFRDFLTAQAWEQFRMKV